MKIQWTSVNDAMPEEGVKIYITDEEHTFVTQAYYHIGMYWQDANKSTQRFPLGAVAKWCDVEEAQRAIDHSVDKAMEHEDYGLKYTPTEALEQMAEGYSKGRWTTEDEREAAYRGYLAGYSAAIDTLGAYKSTEVNDDE